MRTLKVAIVLVALGVVVNSVMNGLLYARAQQQSRVTRELADRTSRDARNTRYVLCTLRNDLEVRATTSRVFLREHPRGIPGVPVKTIRDGLDNQRRTIAALSGLDC